MYRQRIQNFTQIVGGFTIVTLAVYGVLAIFGFNGTLLASAETNAAISGAPTVMNYQGTLKDSDGDPLHGEYNMTFRIYDDPTGGTEPWTEEHTKVSVVQGSFSVLLGYSTPLTADLFSSTERYIGVTVADYGEMSPRGRIASVAYALTATNAVHATNADHATRATYLSAPDGEPIQAVYVDNVGKVGIGTTSPDQRLSVVGRSLAAHDASEEEYVEIWHGGTNGFINTVGDGNLDFRHDNDNKMSLTDTGNLHVNGDITWGGDLKSFSISDPYEAIARVPYNLDDAVKVMTPANKSVCFLTQVFDHSLANSYGGCFINKNSGDNWELEAKNYLITVNQDIQCKARCLSW